MFNESSHGKNNQEERDIPLETKEIIDQEVTRDIAPLIEAEDTETAEFLQTVMQNLRQQTYLFLSWINKISNPQKVLYPASGADTIPKLAFGENKVIHTSLEGKYGEDQSYFENLGTAIKVIADNYNLPFKDESFDVICLLDSQEEIIGNTPETYINLLAPNGLIVISKNNALNPEDNRAESYSEIPSLEIVPVPDNFQMQGKSQVEFTVLKKGLINNFYFK